MNRLALAALIAAVALTPALSGAKGSSSYSGSHSSSGSSTYSSSHSGSHSSGHSSSQSSRHSGGHSSSASSSYSAGGSHSKATSGVPRDSHGKIARDPRQLNSFKKQHPCPFTGKTYGSCLGYIVDHVIPLKRGGADAPSNMQWQTSAAAREKDKWE